MTYKEKAKELIYKYEDLTDGWDYYNDCSKELKQKLPSMKEGALITINEILKIDTALDELIAKDATRKSIIDLAYKNGFKRMIDDGTDKVLKGIIDIHSLIHTIDMTERLIG